MSEDREDTAEFTGDAPGPILSLAGIYAGPAAVATEPADLPVQPPGRLIGRSAPIEQINGLLDDQKTVLLAGVDGIGKTSIAAAVAAEQLRRRPVVWVNASTDTLAGLCDRVARAYGDLHVLHMADTTDKTGAIRDRLTAHEPLVVLDNIRNPKAARGFVRWCTGGLAVLATAPARIPGFTTATAEPLRRTDARELYAHYAGTDLPAPGDQLRALDELCEATGDHAQALAIAGRLSGAHDFSPKEMLAHFRAAANDALIADLPPDEYDGREQMVALMHASVTRLSREGQSAFAALGITLSATAELLAPVAGLTLEDCAECLRELVHLHLAHVKRVDGEVRCYAVSLLAHAYALATLDERGTLDAAEDRLLKSCVNFAARHASRTPESHAMLDMELGNLLGAAAGAKVQGDHDTVNQLAGDLFGRSAFLDTHHYYAQALELLTLGVGAAQALGNKIEESARLNELGMLNAQIGRPLDALACHEQALAAAEAARGDAAASAQTAALRALGELYLTTGDLPRAAEQFGKALEVAREANDKTALGVALANLGAAHALAGDLARAAAYHRQALDLSRDAGDSQTAGVNLANLGRLYDSLGVYDQAIACYEEALKIAREAGDIPAVISRLDGLGHAHRHAGSAEALEAAAARYQEALTLAGQTGARAAEGETLGHLGRLHAQAGDLVAAVDHYTKALAVAREAGTSLHTGNWLFALGESYIQQERWDEAAACLEEALDIRRTHDDPRAEHVEERLKTAQKKAGG